MEQINDLNRYHIPHQKTTLLPRIVCSVIFCYFTFVFLYYYQADILAVAQHILSDGKTHYDKTIGAILITFVLFILEVAIFSWVRLSKVGYALTFFPSLLFLTMITDFDQNLENKFSFSSWLIVFPLLILIWAAVMWIMKEYLTDEQKSKPYSIFSHAMWVNLLELAMMFCMVCLFSNNNDVFHYRARIEQDIIKGQYKDAQLVGEKSEVANPNLVMLRAFSLAKTNQLGEKLFEYPLTGGSNSLIPNDKNIQLLMIPNSVFYRSVGISHHKNLASIQNIAVSANQNRVAKITKDYLLCAYLLDKKLDQFVSVLPKYYPVDSLLPKHYKEALTLYTHLRSNPKLVYRQEVLEADFQDYQTLSKMYPEANVRKTKLRDVYGKTYWYYYQYQAIGQ